MRMYHELRTVIKPNMVQKRKLEPFVEGTGGRDNSWG